MTKYDKFLQNQVLSRMMMILIYYIYNYAII